MSDCLTWVHNPEKRVRDGGLVPKPRPGEGVAPLPDGFRTAIGQQSQRLQFYCNLAYKCALAKDTCCASIPTVLSGTR